MECRFKVYLLDDREYFEYMQGDGRAIKKDFAFSQSLLDLLYLDIWSNEELFEKIGADLRRLYETRDGALAEEIKKALDALAKKHIYFEFLRLNWYAKLDKAAKQGFESILDLLPYKNISHIPSNIQTMQEQIKHLFSSVLDILSPDGPIQQKMVNYYNAEGNDRLGTFQFQPQATNFEAVGNSVFTEVLYPKDIYDMIDFFLRACVKREQRFRVCKNCGKYFALTGYSNTEYCDRLYGDTGKTCKEIGAINTWQRKRVENPVVKAYSKAYKKRFAWIKYKKITKEAFYEWSEQARAMRDKCLKGEISLEEYKEWLNR